jgi:predicted aldo/keto reductase-like oxidoreductase
MNYVFTFRGYNDQQCIRPETQSSQGVAHRRSTSFFLTTIFPTTVFRSSIDMSSVLPAEIWELIAHESDLLRIQALTMVSSYHVVCVALVDRVALSRRARSFAMH